MTAAGTSVSFSMASLNSPGVTLSSPAASNRYSGTGSVIATGAPSWAALIAATWVDRSATDWSNVAALAW